MYDRRLGLYESLNTGDWKSIYQAANRADFDEVLVAMYEPFKMHYEADDVLAMNAGRNPTNGRKCMACANDRVKLRKNA